MREKKKPKTEKKKKYIYIYRERERERERERIKLCEKIIYSIYKIENYAWNERGNDKFIV